MGEGRPIAKVPRVVIVGGGSGGLYAPALWLKSSASHPGGQAQLSPVPAAILYQVAAGILPADEIAPPLRVLFSKQKNVDVVMADVTGVDTANRRVLLPEFDLPYDYLILATGIEVNYFGHDE